MEQEERTPRHQAELILDWARTHILNPCGQGLVERDFMKRTHQEVVRNALQEPGVRETLTVDEIEELQDLLQR